MRSSQLDQKRNKYLKQIRYRHHQQYFDLHRQRQAAQLPAVAYLPILIQNQYYDDIMLVMDCIQIGSDAQLDPKTSDIIQERCQHHSDPKIRRILFILKNRIGRWTYVEANKAVNLVIEGDELFIKQLAIYLQAKFVNMQKKASSKLSTAQKSDRILTQSQKQLQYNQYCKQLSHVFNKILPLPPKSPQIRLCWLDIVCRTLELNASNISQCLVNKSIDSFILAIDIGVNNCTQFQLVRVLKIISMLVESGQYTDKVVNMDCFSKIVQFIRNGSIEIVVEGFQTLAQIMSQDEKVIKKLVQKYKIIELFKKYIDHIMLSLQIRVLWGISNIAGSQQYTVLFKDKQIMQALFQKSSLQQNLQLRMQAYHCILNIISNSNHDIIDQISLNYPLLDTLIQIIHQLADSNIKSIILQRTLYALYHLLSEYPQAWLKFQQHGVKNMLERLYQNQKQQNKIKMIDQAIQMYERCGKQIQNSSQKN